MPQDAPPAHTVMVPVRGWVSLRLGDVWRARELLLIFAWRDLSARYRQTVLGVIWAVLQPVTMTVVFTLFLGRLAKLPSDGAPYAVFALSGLIPWALLSNAVGAGSESLLSSGGVITKVHFPRLVLPLGAIAAWLSDLLIATAVLIPVMFVYGLAPTWTALLAPVFALGIVLVAAGASLLLAPLNVAYRDVRYLTVMLLQLWMFATPVVYPLSKVPADLRWLYGLNPMVGFEAGFRWAMLGAGGPTSRDLLSAIVVTLAGLLAGLAYFRRVEHRLADVI
ncbi:MAG TPA: ABC transporter permease [Acidimicrobiales bacterium]|nr:ABC transporter permease [Acidimicrobiales bacterium]